MAGDMPKLCTNYELNNDSIRSSIRSSIRATVALPMSRLIGHQGNGKLNQSLARICESPGLDQ